MSLMMPGGGGGARYAGDVIALALALATLPPLPPFPTELRPRDGSVAPVNAAVFALGDPAPALDQIGVAVTNGGAPASFEGVEAVGCCVARVRLTNAPAIGDVMTVTVTSAFGESTAAWTAGPADDTNPQFTTPPSVIDHGQRAGAYEVVIGFEATDDTQIGMVTASLSDDLATIAGVTVDGFVLTARVPGQRAPGELCLTLVAVDVAENVSAPQVLCVTVVDVEPSEGEGEGEGEPSGCAGGGGVPLALVFLGLLRPRARNRERAMTLDARC